LGPGNPVYNRPVAYRLTGHLNIEALERSLHELVRRHAALRTIFPAHDGEPEQVVATNFSPALTLIDLVNVPESERHTETLRRAIEASRQAFDLAKGPLFRARLFRLSEADHLLLFVSHHIIFDGWSESVLNNELALLYNAFIHGDSSQLPELSM